MIKRKQAGRAVLGCLLGLSLFSPAKALAEDPPDVLVASLEEEDLSGAIFLIDSGVAETVPVVKRLSVLGDEGLDLLGHGTRMAELILSQNRDAKIVSVKAVDEEGKGTIEALIKAVLLAIEQKASVISLSVSTPAGEDSEALTALLNRAVYDGITVIGAAGNDGIDSRYTLPGCIKEALIIGAATESGEKQPLSNFGETVDYYIPAGNTSEACALYCGYFSTGGLSDLKVFAGVSEDETAKTGKVINHIGFLDQEAFPDTLIRLSTIEKKVSCTEEYLIDQIVFCQDDWDKLSGLQVLLDFASTVTEKDITDECILSPEEFAVRIPRQYENEAVTIRFYLPEQSWLSYVLNQDQTGQIHTADGSFDPFPASMYESDTVTAEMLSLMTGYLQGLYGTVYYHTAKSPNDRELPFPSAEQIKAFEALAPGQIYEITAGDYVVIDGFLNAYGGSNGVITNLFGGSYVDPPTAYFLIHFDEVIPQNGSELAAHSLLSNFGSTFSRDISLRYYSSDNPSVIKEVNAKSMTTSSGAEAAWVYGSCGGGVQDGKTGYFSGGRIYVVSKTETEASFFYYITSPRGQNVAGSFSLSLEQKQSPDYYYASLYAVKENAFDSAQSFSDAVYVLLDTRELDLASEYEFFLTAAKTASQKDLTGLTGTDRLSAVFQSFADALKAQGKQELAYRIRFYFADPLSDKNYMLPISISYNGSGFSFGQNTGLFYIGQSTDHTVTEMASSYALLELYPPKGFAIDRHLYQFTLKSSYKSNNPTMPAPLAFTVIEDLKAYGTGNARVSLSGNAFGSGSYDSPNFLILHAADEPLPVIAELPATGGIGEKRLQTLGAGLCILGGFMFLFFRTQKEKKG